MRFFTVCLAILFLSLPAYAQEPSLTVLCRALKNHQPSADVSYRPGVDMNGNPVVPADVEDQSAFTVGTVYIPVEIDLIQRFGGNVPADVGLLPEVSLVAVYEDGRVTYNGQDISAQTVYACSGQASEMQLQTKPALQKDGQAAPDVINSGETIKGKENP